ncbi:ribonuclease P protein component [Candidatus Saccharibacteria bacterium]|nr:MAG: ribonuclease P protein component [Candidatus Saccharibacteria bacterium]
MIARTNRFHGHGSLKYLYAKGKTVRGAGLSLRFVPNTKRELYRAAVVVSKKVSKSAVTRNRIRRRLYENVRILSTDFKGVYDLAILVYDERYADMPAEKLTAEVKDLCKKAKILA